MKTTESHNKTELKIEGFTQAELKKNAFKMPEGYFDGLTPRIMASIRESEQLTKKPMFSWGKILVPGFGIAALALAVWLFSDPNENATQNFDTVLASLSVEDLALYADLQPSELVLYELVDYDQFALSESQITEEDIIDFLESEEDVELNTIIDEIEI